MYPTPTDIKAQRDAQVLRVTWSDQRNSELPFVYLRGECQCAGCVDERTGIRILDLDSIPRDIVIDRMELVGNYAVRIHWSDGHSTGLFTWERLQQLGR